MTWTPTASPWEVGETRARTSQKQTQTCRWGRGLQSVNRHLTGTIPGSVQGSNGGPGQGEAGQGPGSYSGPIGSVTGRRGIGGVLRWLPLPRGGPEGDHLDGAVASRSPSCPHCPLTFSPLFSPTLCFSHSGILTVPETRQAHSCLRGFAQAAPCRGVPLKADFLSSAGLDPF